MTRAESRTLLSRSHVSSLTGEYTYPIYHQRVVNVDNGTFITLSMENVLHNLWTGTLISAGDTLISMATTSLRPENRSPL